MFESIQGEGPFCCRRALFIRLAGCNLRCPFCDTPYSLDPRDGAPRSVEELASKAAGHGGLVVLTGGEPLLQRRGLNALLEALWRLSPGQPVQLETNGTLPPPDRGEPLYMAYHVVSPKDVPVRVQGARTHPGWFRYARETGRAWFKLLASGWDEAREAVEWALSRGAPRESIYLMPVTSDEMSLEELLRVHREAAGWALRLGVNFSPRMHLLLGLK